MKIRTLLPVVAVLGAVAAPAFAQQPAATDLTALLKQTQQVRSEAEAKFDARRQEFEGTPEAQKAALTTKADQQRKEFDTASQKLADAYAANEVRINNLNNQLRDKAMKLGLAEVFGLARQAANDASTVLQQSLITTQFPPAAGQPSRDEWMRQFAAARGTPTAAELERVWIEIQREMTASGQVAKYKTRIVQPGGQNVDADVIRIGPFNATANGQFLSYLPNLHVFTVLPRQLPAEFMSVAAAFQNATSGYAQAVVDPNRGVLVGMYTERPTFMGRIQLGQEIGYVIMTVGALGALAFLFQLVSLVLVRLSVSTQLKHLDRPTPNNPLGRVLLAFKGDKNRIEEDSEVAELRITEAVLHEVPRLERFQAFLRLAVASGPLLGLIGTVWGMIITFQSITESGSSDPKLMATGIGQAMIATVLGLGVAIPLLFANALLNSLSRGVVQVLDEQSAGMLAESIEKKRHA
ncbi:MAG: MotA/TolQ/ExbB proton channel family protein [Gammaproteobacteria bacterium]